MGNRRKLKNVAPETSTMLPVVNGEMLTPDELAAKAPFASFLRGQLRNGGVPAQARKVVEYALLAVEADYGFWVAGEGVWALHIPQSDGEVVRYTLILEDDGPRFGMQADREARLYWSGKYPVASEALLKRISSPDFQFALQMKRQAKLSGVA